MKFEFTEEQCNIKNAVREFCEKEFKPELALELDKKEEFPMELYRKAAHLGFTSMFFPEEYGGQGCGLLETCMVIEEMCRADSSFGVAISSGNFGSELILTCGTKEQKDKYLPPICKGEYMSAAAFTEPNVSGSDITRMETTATKYGNEWWINGTKTFITNATLANFIIVLTQTDTKTRPTYRGETLFVVNKDTPGLETTKLHNKMGIRCSVTGEIKLDNVKVADRNIVGELNRGFYTSMEFFDKTRVGVAAQALGIAQGAWEIAFKYSKQREAFGQPLLQHELIGCGLAEAMTKIEAARWLTYRAAWLVDAEKMDPMATAMAKQYASRVAMETTDFAIQILGAYGYLGEYRVERYHRDAKITEIYEGTSEIQKLTVLKYLLRKF
ncbi:MAG TPA: acyl-CoA dehydrogenase family protein [Candidatus Paceibacterota bacterium]|nr:acyl-CoA dehydrogenase family protein [Candidatus Paceibacterota bacterium]